ncbi:hypothetical protein FJZ36_09455 [Candidatus Poribacteria bacterium]|nr:hypothetical protein [Candidatus Poribacteria bacterium]
MTRRIFISAVLALALTAAAPVVAQVNETNDGATFSAKVGIIVKWLNPAEEVSAPVGNLRDWSNALSTDTGDTDTVAVLRLVTNVDVRLTGTADPLTHPDNAAETLATFVCVQTDGSGLEEAVIDGTGDPATGFEEDQYAPARGVGPDYEDGRFNFVYVGGGSNAADTEASNTWVSPTRLAELSAVPAHNAQFSMGALLGDGALIKHVPRDGSVLVRVTMRALNGEDFGIDSDDTEAPDVASDSPYTATVQLTALP